MSDVSGAAALTGSESGYTNHPPNSPPPGSYPPEPPQKKERNTVGLIALIVAIVGFIFACIPGALIVGWILLPIAFVLSIVGLVLSGKAKGTSIAAIIISIIGVIVGFIVFFVVVGSAFDEAFGGEDVEITAPEEEAENEGDEEPGGDEESDGGEEPGGGADSNDEGDGGTGEEGDRDTPVTLGSTISSEDWDVTITNFDRDATEEVLAANEGNEDPKEGNTYAVIDFEVTYTGDESATPWTDIDFAYVTEDGKTIHPFDTKAISPEPRFADLGELYEGGSDNGKELVEIPGDDNGLLRVTPGLFADDVFVALD